MIRTPEDHQVMLFSELDHIIGNPRYLIGKSIYISGLTSENAKKYGLKQKLIGNEIYYNLAYESLNGNTNRARTDKEIKNLASKFTTNNDNASNIINLPFLFADLITVYDKKYLVKTFDPRAALETIISRNKIVYEALDEVSKMLNIGLNCIGITGSCSIGARDWSDLDFVFYASKDGMRELLERIDYYRTKYGEAAEHGIRWPCRFFTKSGHLICSFFNYTTSDYLSPLVNSELLETPAKDFDFYVTDDTHTLSKTPTLLSKTSKYNKLIILSSAFKGVFRNGYRIRGRGIELISKSSSDNMARTIVCADPFKEIEDWVKFFNKTCDG